MKSQCVLHHQILGGIPTNENTVCYDVIRRGLTKRKNIPRYLAEYPAGIYHQVPVQSYKITSFPCGVSRGSITKNNPRNEFLAI